MTRLRRPAVLILFVSAIVCLVAALAVPAAARADRRDTVAVALDGAPFRVRPVGGLLEVGGLAPGQQRSAVMGVRSGMHDAAELMLRMIQVEDLDNSCTRPERSVDGGCGRGRGDLGRELRYAIEVAPAAAGPYAALWSGTAAQLQHGIDARMAFDPGATRWIRMTASLPGRAGNEVETDTFRFGLRVVLQATEGTAGVAVNRDGGAASVVGDGGGGAGVSSGLSATGIVTALLVATAIALALAGAVLLLVGRRRRRPIG